MQQILSVWSTLDTRRRIIVLGATLAMFAAVLGLSRMASQPTMTLLYAGLEPAAAGEVVAALEQTGVAYDVREGAIFVESGRRDALRMTLAAEGLPAASKDQGYEILDSLTGFGTTSQMFDAAYWRAKEGELARTIVASPKIKGARVHISNPSSNPFQRNLKPTASVTVSTNSGALASGHAKALKYLVASAVAGLSPDDVSIIDGRGGLVLPGDDTSGVTGSDDRAAELRRNIQRILEARVGYGNAVVEVSVETVTEREAIVERRFDPENRVAISSETEERSNTSSGTQGGAVTVASNLPEGDVGGGENSSRSENSETRERVNYEVSETTREVLRTPGAIKRVSVAVLVDGLSSIDATTGEETWQPRPEEEMAALQELVGSVVGFDADRGDTITLKSMEFEPVIAELPSASPSLFQMMNLDVMSMVQIAVLAIVALVLGLFVVRPILSSRSQVETGALSSPDAIGFDQPVNALPASELPGLGDVSGAPALTGEIDDGLMPIAGLPIMSPEGMMSDNHLLGGSDDNLDPVERLRKLIEERKEETVEILRSWMEDHEGIGVMDVMLEDFEVAASMQPAEPVDSVPRSVVEAEKMATYEQGYRAGWDDATRAEAEDQSRIGAEFARSLQDLSFTFHEARAHVIQAMEPLLNELIEKFLPDLVSETLGLKIIEELHPLIEEGSDSPIQLVVAPLSRNILEKQLADANMSAIQLTEEPSLAEGQAYLRVGKVERQIDMTGALERISDAIQSLYALNERTLKHA